MLRRLLMAGLVLAAGTANAQFQQQRQDDLGIMSAPSSGTSSTPGTVPIQQTTPLSIPQVQSPTITNNPDYPRQPIFVPSPSFPLPGQGQVLQQQQGVHLPGQARPQAPAQPRQSATEQRGRGAFTAPGVTRELTGERSEFQDF